MSKFGCEYFTSGVQLLRQRRPGRLEVITSGQAEELWALSEVLIYYILIYESPGVIVATECYKYIGVRRSHNESERSTKESEEAREYMWHK